MDVGEDSDGSRAEQLRGLSALALVFYTVAEPLSLSDLVLLAGREAALEAFRPGKGNEGIEGSISTTDPRRVCFSGG